MHPISGFKRGAIPAAVAGVLAYVVGYGVAFAATAVGWGSRFDSIASLSTFIESESVATWRTVGWLYHGAHGVALDVSGDAPIAAGEGTIDVSGAVPDVIYVVPVLMLLGAGFFAANYTGVEDPRTGLLVGGTVTIGYGLAALLGSVVFGVSGVRPHVVTSVAIAGIAYPLVLGTIGGALESVSHTFEPRGTDQLE